MLTTMTVNMIMMLGFAKRLVLVMILLLFMLPFLCTTTRINNDKSNGDGRSFTDGSVGLNDRRFIFVAAAAAAAAGDSTETIHSDDDGFRPTDFDPQQQKPPNLDDTRRIHHAKELLISLGVPSSNLCTNDVGGGRNRQDHHSIHDLLPPCSPEATMEMETDSSKIFFSSSSWYRWMMIPRQERRRLRRHHQRQDEEQQQTHQKENHPNRDRYLLEGGAGGSEETNCAETEEVHSFEDDPWFFLTHAACALACVTTAALAAGLTMGLLSLDPLMLLIKMRAGATQREKDQAAALLPIVKQHHLLLVTLLLLNSMANEALPLFLEVLVSPVVAVILSVTFVLFFGEIIPSAVFTYVPTYNTKMIDHTLLFLIFFHILHPLLSTYFHRPQWTAKDRTGISDGPNGKDRHGTVMADSVPNCKGPRRCLTRRR